MCVATCICEQRIRTRCRLWSTPSSTDAATSGHDRSTQRSHDHTQHSRCTLYTSRARQLHLLAANTCDSVQHLCIRAPLAMTTHRGRTMAHRRQDNDRDGSICSRRSRFGCIAIRATRFVMATTAPRPVRRHSARTSCTTFAAVHIYREVLQACVSGSERPSI